MVQPARPQKVRNEDIARAFDEVADLLDLEKGNPFRSRALSQCGATG